MERPWNAEHAVAVDVARELVETRFPELAPARVEVLGVGWDNTALRVNEAWVFRFPRRPIAVELLEVETRLLPAIASRVPLPVPVPTMVARGDERFPRPFAGYRMLPGRTACTRDLDEHTRAAAAAPIAAFLAALHAVPAGEAAAHGAGPDAIRRLDVRYRVGQVARRLDEAVTHGLVDDPAPIHAIAEATPLEWTPGSGTLVHGDLYARHLLVDDAGAPCGVIDWGDVHLGDRAVDLALAAGFLPPPAQTRFREAYGPIDEDTWTVARFRALHAALAFLLYGHDTGDADLVREARVTLRHLEGAA